MHDKIFQISGHPSSLLRSKHKHPTKATICYAQLFILLQVIRRQEPLTCQITRTSHRYDSGKRYSRADSQTAYHLLSLQHQPQSSRNPGYSDYHRKNNRGSNSYDDEYGQEGYSVGTNSSRLTSAEMWPYNSGAYASISSSHPSNGMNQSHTNTALRDYHPVGPSEGQAVPRQQSQVQNFTITPEEMTTKGQALLADIDWMLEESRRLLSDIRARKETWRQCDARARVSLDQMRYPELMGPRPRAHGAGVGGDQTL